MRRVVIIMMMVATMMISMIILIIDGSHYNTLCNTHDRNHVTMMITIIGMVATLTIWR